jgi:cell division protein FtsB
MSEEHLAAETRKFIAEHDKLAAERDKLSAEREKLFQEALKLERERWWFPWLQVVTAIAAIIAALGVLLRH